MPSMPSHSPKTMQDGHQLNTAPQAAAALPSSAILGDAGSRTALRLIQEELAYLKKKDVLAFLQKALTAFHKADWAGGRDYALKAIETDKDCGEAWHILAVAYDKTLELPQAFRAYEEALKRLPENAGIANDLGRLAYRLGHTDVAIRFFRYFLQHNPANMEAVNNLASALREESRYEESVDLLKAILTEHPDQSALWNVLGTVLAAQGDVDTAIVFFDQAVQLDPANAHALYNLGNMRSFKGDIDGGIALLQSANTSFTEPSHQFTCRLSLAYAYLCKGDLVNGWEWYKARQKMGMADEIRYLIPRPRWSDGQSLEGKRVFVSAEQGLGDEVMFGTILPDLLREIGPAGKLGIGVEPRLVPLFQRSFPTAHVVKHLTAPVNGLPMRIYPDVEDWEAYDHWMLMADLLPRYRSRVEDFPAQSAFLKPDPERVAHWRNQLAAVNDKPKIGILWKSLINHSQRNRGYTPFDDWADVLSLKDIQFVNLQYGDATAELEQAKALGIDIWTPPGIDLRADLDDLSALCVAIDCVLGPSNATSNLAGAAGGRIWMLSLVRAWTMLGTDHSPWYKTSRVFLSESMLDWQPMMQSVRTALNETFVNPSRSVA